MNLEPLVRATVERLADVVPLSPMAKLECDAILTAMAEQVRSVGNVADKFNAKLTAEALKIKAENDFLRQWIRGEMTLADTDIDQAFAAHLAALRQRAGGDNPSEQTT